MTGAICNSLAPEAVRKAAASALTPSEGGSSGAPLPLSRKAASGCCWLGRRLFRLEAAGCVCPAAACCFDIFADGLTASLSDRRLHPTVSATGAPHRMRIVCVDGAFCHSGALIALHRVHILTQK